MSEEQLTKKERKALKKQEQEEHRQRENAERRAARKKTSIIVIVSAVLIVAFLAWIVNNAPEQERIVDETPTEIQAIDETDNTKGASEENAKITIVEYSDFECPACAQYYPILKQLVETYSDDIRFVYRHLPLQQIHPNATLAARFAEAAGIQGKFFEMHDLIFENQGVWAGASIRVAKNTFKDLGESLDLDVEKLEADADTDAVRQKIESHRIDAIGAGAEGTPSFYIDGALIDNPRNYEEFETIILEAIGRSVPVSNEVPILQDSHMVQ